MISHPLTAPHRMYISLTSFPAEIISSIIVHLPIDSNLIDVALASPLFAKAIFHSFYFARKHFEHQLNLSNSASLWDYLNDAGLYNAGYQSMPFNYQAVIHGNLLAANEWTGLSEQKHRLDGGDPGLHLMWPWRWNLESSKAVCRIKTLLSNKHYRSIASNERSFLWAVRCNRLDIVQLVMEANPSLDPVEKLQGGSAMLWAVKCGHTRILEYFLQNPHIDPAFGRNVYFRAACMFGNLETAQFLLAFSPTVDPSACGNFSIITASYKGYVDIVQFLLQDPRVDPSVLFANHNGVFLEIFSNGHLEVVMLLLADARINLDPTESLAMQCLGVACANGHLPLAQFLVELGVCPEGNDNYAVLVACVEGQTEIVKYLLGDHRVNPSCRSNLPIQKAAQFGHLDIVNLLLARKDVDPSDIQNKAIRLAAFRRNHHIVERLLQHPLVDPSDYNNEAIRIASQKGDHRTVAALLRDKRVNPSVNDNEAFHSCCIIPNQAANDDERPAPDISDYVKVMTLLAKDSRFKADKKVYKILKPFYDATVDDE